MPAHPKYFFIELKGYKNVKVKKRLENKYNNQLTSKIIFNT